MVLLVLPAAPSLAQDAVAEPTEIGASGKDYLGALRLRRIDTDVSYFDPSAPPPELNTRQTPERQPRDGEGLDIVFDLPFALISSAILLAIVFLFYRYGGSMSVSLRSEAENARRARGGVSLEGDGEGVPVTLQGILKLSDRRMALVLLAKRALETAVAANGTLFQRSWTARDALRRVQGAPDDVAALRALVLESERVQFGGRDVSEDSFQTHLTAIRPLIEGDTG